jgi:hypothetical protein
VALDEERSAAHAHRTGRQIVKRELVLAGPLDRVFAGVEQRFPIGSTSLDAVFPRRNATVGPGLGFTPGSQNRGVASSTGFSRFPARLMPKVNTSALRSKIFPCIRVRGYFPQRRVRTPAPPWQHR